MEVDVSGCTGFEGRCPLWLGTSHNFTLRFTPNQLMTSDKGLERQIYAKFPEQNKEPPVEIPYGPAVDANAHTTDTSTGEPISQTGNQFVVGHTYVHNGIFPVISQAPKVSAC